jgi:hypothetical protein
MIPVSAGMRKTLEKKKKKKNEIIIIIGDTYLLYNILNASHISFPNK